MFVTLPSEQLLPPICPVCGADGMHPRSVFRPVIQTRSDPDADPKTAHYCDRGHEHLLKKATRFRGLIAAGTLFSLALVTFLSLSWGTRAVLGQVLLTCTCGLGVAALIFRLGLPSHGELGILEFGLTSRGIRYWVLPAFGRLLDRARTQTRANDAKGARRAVSGAALLSLLPMGLALAWLTALQLWGDARFRVLHAGPSDLVLLVDFRRAATARATQFEDPLAGRFVRVLGGRRRLTLLTHDGRPLAETTITVWPGRTYIVGHLTEHQCLYVERRAYGASGREHTLSRLEGSAPVWEIDFRVDSWFQPLPPKEQSEMGPIESVPQGLTSSGGLRTAIRLLPCAR